MTADIMMVLSGFFLLWLQKNPFQEHHPLTVFQRVVASILFLPFLTDKNQ